MKKNIKEVLLEAIRKDLIGHSIEVNLFDVKVIARNITNVDLAPFIKGIEIEGDIEVKM